MEGQCKERPGVEGAEGGCDGLEQETTRTRQADPVREHGDRRSVQLWEHMSFIEYIVYGSKILLFCQKLTFFGA